MTYPKLTQNKEIIDIFNWHASSIILEKYKDKIESLNNQMKDSILLCEVFDTIQGEWLSIGKPVIFIRTYGCNLKCGFANPDGIKGCDTPYTWKTSATQESDKNRYTPEMLVDEILQYPNHRHWVITWGEPLLQGDKFIKVFEEYKSRIGIYPYIEFETNGTIVPSKALDKYVGHYSVSIKLENSNATEKTGYTQEDEEYNWNTRERRIKEAGMKFFTTSPKAYFKFVVDRYLSSLQEIKELQAEFDIPNEKIWVMPEGNSLKDINAASLPLIEVCKSEGYRFSTRLHIMIWGCLRGV